MTPKEQKDLLMAFLKFMNLPILMVNESIVDDFLRFQLPTSERYKATMAFFDKLPDGLREMAKENYEESSSIQVPTRFSDALGCGFEWRKTAQKYSFWERVTYAISEKLPSITLNGTTYDLTKCYE